jgi:hypothetical protein
MTSVTLGGACGLDQALEHGVVVGWGVGVGGVDVRRGLSALSRPADGVIEAGGRWRCAAGAAGARCPCAETDVALDRLADQALGATDAYGEVAEGGERFASPAEGDEAVAGGLPVEACTDDGLGSIGGGLGRKSGPRVGGWLIELLSKLHDRPDGEQWGLVDERHLLREGLDSGDGRAEQAEPPGPQGRCRGRGGSRHRGEGESAVVCHGLARL